MRPLDWRALLEKQRVPYVERGANVKRGELNIRCPWCGDADPSMHMGINLGTGWYACWRNRKQHSGKSPVRLLMRLLRIGYGAARELAGLGEDYVDPEGFDAVVARLMGRGLEAGGATPGRRFLVMPPEFLEVTRRAATGRWWNYLHGRYFDADDVETVCRVYGLRACREGPFGGRLILPYYQDGRLVTWTGRAVGQSDVRYRDLEVDLSLVKTNDALYNFDRASDPRSGRKVLLVCEGPVDALKADFYGARLGVRAVALSTNSASRTQVLLLEELAEGFGRTVVVMDSKTTYGAVDGMRMAQELATVPRVTFAETPFGRGDPGELRPQEARQWAADLTGAT